MLDLAINHADAVSSLFRNTAFDLKYKYFYTEGYAENLIFKPEENTWNKIQLVSVNETNELIGYIEYSMKNPMRIASLTMLSYGKSSSFLPDVNSSIKKIFNEFNIPKISFCVLIGNPAEKLYDRFVSMHGGRIVGIRKKHCLNMALEVCDLKSYEILKEDYRE